MGTAVDIPPVGEPFYDFSEALSPLRLGFSNLPVAAGYSNMSMPEITVETQDVNQATAQAPTKIILGASIGSITLSRAVYLLDDDFYQWVRMAVQGKTYKGMFRRDLLMIWFSERVRLGPLPAPLKAFLLVDVIPLSYKPGSDFDPSSSAVSLQELVLFPADYQEVSLTL